MEQPRPSACSVAGLSQRVLDRVRAVPTDVSNLEDVRRLKDKVYAAFGEVAVVMNNAGPAARRLTSDQC